jgi:hypothetical protein
MNLSVLSYTVSFTTGIPVRQTGYSPERAGQALPKNRREALKMMKPVWFHRKIGLVSLQNRADFIVKPAGLQYAYKKKSGYTVPV